MEVHSFIFNSHFILGRVAVALGNTVDKTGIHHGGHTSPMNGTLHTHIHTLFYT